MGVFGIKDGWASSNGVISANGDTVAKFIYSLYSKSNFVASTVVWYGLDIDGFIDVVNSPNYDKTNINADAKRFASSGITNISKISGNYEIDHGIIKFMDTTFSTKYTSGIAAASYNIYNSSVDTTVNAIFSPVGRDRYHPPAPVEVTIHTSGNIDSTVKEVGVGSVKHEIDKKGVHLRAK